MQRHIHLQSIMHIYLHRYTYIANIMNHQYIPLDLSYCSEISQLRAYFSMNIISKQLK